jgi:hypothetical protein
MTENRAAIAPREDAGKATVEGGSVILDGPDGVAVTMTADAAEKTADSLHRAAMQARSSLREPRESRARWLQLNHEWTLAEQAARRAHACNTLSFQESTAGRAPGVTSVELAEAARLQSVADDLRALVDAFLETVFSTNTTT